MKKKMLILLTVCLISACFCGCVGQKSEETVPTETIDKAAEKNNAKEAEKEKIETENTQESTDLAVAEDDSTVDNTLVEKPDPDFDITPVATTVDTPAKMGEWVETKVPYSDSQYHTVYYRITGIVRDQDEIQDAVEESGKIITLDPLDEHMEYRMLTYEVYFPSEFQQQDTEITNSSTDLSFYLTNPDGFNYFDTDDGSFRFLSGSAANATTEQSYASYDVNVGDIFTGGKAIFPITRDASDYMFETSYTTKDSEIGRSYVLVEENK